MGLLDVSNLQVEYESPRGMFKAVDGVSFSIERGEMFGLAGESGCGKSTTAYGISRLLRPPARLAGGSIVFDGKPLTSLTEAEFRPYRWSRISVVLQSAMNNDRIGIMYAGKMVEVGSAEQLLGGARHPYTQGLLRSFPSLSGPKVRIEGIPGSPPNLVEPPAGCRFQSRCPHATDVCSSLEPSAINDDRGMVACHLYGSGEGNHEAVAASQSR
ncbi:oligopeptide/dipeptide ABC transporter ATP-binding protein [Paenibacillus sp. MCAF20]